MNHDGIETDILDLAIRESIAGRIASAAADLWSRAWPSSSTAAVATDAFAVWRQLSSPQKLRSVALMLMCAMAFDRVLALTGPHEPLGAVLPSIVFVVSATFAVFADPIARASERLRR